MTNIPQNDDMGMRVLLAEERTELANERTVLAAERTLSAWIRTGLAGVGGGLWIIHLLPIQDPLHKAAAHLLGELIMFWGICIFVFGYVSYRLFCKRLETVTGYTSPAQSFLSTLVYIILFFSVLFLIITIRRLHF